MSETLVLATRNPGKLAELRRILLEADLTPRLFGVEEFPDVAEVAETGATFAANALLKACAVAAATGLPAVADDSGLCVDALGGMPGILSARWAGRHGDDRANLELVLAQRGDVPNDRRGAHFTCAAALALPDGTAEVVEGRIAGRLLREQRGTNGFGYDPIFLPDGHARGFGEMTAEEKHGIPADGSLALSHRARAFQALARACL